MAITYTYTDLVRRMYDLEQLALPPVPGERGGCFSSYDRRSVYEEASGHYLNTTTNTKNMIY